MITSIAFCLVQQIMAVQDSSEQKVQILDVQVQSTNPTWLRGSLMGGTILILTVVGLDPEMQNNQVYLGENPCRIPEDGINGLTIKCVTAATDPTETIIPNINNYNYWYYNAARPRITIKVKDKEDSQYSYFYFEQSIDATPLIKSTFPHSMIPGNIISLDFQYQFYWNYEKFGFKVGSQICVPFEYNYFISSFYIPNMESGYYDYSINSDFGNSYALYDVYQKKVGEDQLFQGKIIPIIKNLSSNLGSYNGQILDIYGLGFSEDISNIKVLISGYNLSSQILKSNMTNIQVKLQNFTKNTQNIFLQSSGLKYTRYNLSKKYESCPKFIQQLKLNQTKLQESIIIDEIATEAEFQKVNIFNYSDYYRGFFKAPKTGQYRFYLQSDDWSALYFQKQPNIINTTNLTMILQSNKGSFRAYFQEYSQSTQNSHISEYINLNKNDFYYLEVIHCSFNQGGHLSVSVEIEEEQRTKRSLSDVYVLNTSKYFIPQIVEIYMYNQEGDYLLQGQYKIALIYLQNENQEIIMYDQWDQYLGYNSTAEQFKNYIDQPQFYGYQYYANQIITAERVNYQGIPIKNQQQNQFAGFKYTITFNNSVWWENYQYYQLKVISNRLTSDKGKPCFESKLIQNQSKPIQGQLQIEITYFDKQGDLKQQLLPTPFGYSNDDTQISSFHLNCYQLPASFSKIFKKQPLCWSDGDQNYKINLVLQFRDIYEISTVEIVYQNLTSGDQNVQAFLTKVFEKSNNTLYEPIPNELLFTMNQQPQVNLYVNNILSACFGDVCNYDLSSTISPTLVNFNITNDLLTLEIIPSSQFKEINDTQLDIQYGGSQCNQINVQKKGSSFLIQCQLELMNGQLVVEAGDIIPKVHIYPIGFVRIDSKVSPKTQNIIINSISPSIGSSAGGTLITIKGSGFPANMNQSNNFTLKVGGLVVVPLLISNQMIQVITPPQSTDNKVEIEFNGKYFQSSLFQYDQSQIIQIQSLEYTDRSPIFKGYMKIFATNLGTDIQQLNCTIENANKTYIAPIKSIDGNELTVYLRGGMPGEYKIIINKVGYGKSWPQTQDSNKFKYGVFITSVNPQVGSEGGGTVITITGRNIILEETLVFIGNALNQYCDVNLTLSTDDQIICKTSPKPDLPYYSKPVQVAVITRGSLESICDLGADCSFQYLDELTPRLLARPQGLLNLSVTANQRILQEEKDVSKQVQKLFKKSSKSGISHFSSQRRSLQQDESEIQLYKSYIYGETENVIIKSGQEDSYQIVFQGDIYYYVIDAIIDEVDKSNIKYVIPNIPQGDYKTYISTSKGYADLTWLTRIELKVTQYPSIIYSGGQDIILIGQGFNYDQNLQVLISNQKCLKLKVINFNQIECQSPKIEGWTNSLAIIQNDQVTDSPIKIANIFELAWSAISIGSLVQSESLVINEENYNYLADISQINLSIQGYNLNQGTTSSINLQQSDNKFEGVIISKDLYTMEAQFLNIPIGKYVIVIKVDSQYISSNFRLLVQGNQDITSQLIQSSIAGGSYLRFQGAGFDQNKTNNKIKVCGFECNVVRVNTDNLICETPEVFTRQNLEEQPSFQKEFKILNYQDFYFVSSDNNQQEYFKILFDGSQYTCSYQIQQQSKIDLEINQNMILELKSIRFQTIADKQSFQRLNGTKFQYMQSGQQGWVTFETINTNIQLGYNTIYLSETIKNIKKLRIWDEQGTGRSQICELKILGRLTYDAQNQINEDVFCDAQLQINEFSLPIFEKAMNMYPLIIQQLYKLKELGFVRIKLFCKLELIMLFVWFRMPQKHLQNVKLKLKTQVQIKSLDYSKSKQMVVQRSISNQFSMVINGQILILGEVQYFLQTGIQQQFKKAKFQLQI